MTNKGCGHQGSCGHGTIFLAAGFALPNTMTRKNNLVARKSDYSVFVSLERQREEKRIRKRKKIREKMLEKKKQAAAEGGMDVDAGKSSEAATTGSVFGQRKRRFRKKFSKTRQRLVQKLKQQKKNNDAAKPMATEVKK